MSRGTLSLKSVGKTWTPEGRAPVEAVRDFSLDVAPGEFVIFLGPSGCGKSTLLYMIAGLESVSSGTIEQDGLAVTEPSAERGLIFQEAGLFPWLTIADNVGFGLSIQGEAPVRRREAVAQLLRQVGLGDMMDKKPDELSGGMRQRAACARALAMRPDILMMDEPFAALDVQTRAKMQDFLLQIWRDSGASIILVTHSIDEAIALADRVVVFTARPGRIKTIVPIDLPRPRPSRDPRYHQYRDLFTDLLAAEVDRAFAEQEA
ncbi:ABC transporter ATP-binding protein [Oharaeibacter diazotrophicus]|uniref:NitT/TauT family transport system ATP-binding protein n=1 Tax=Oharaeibacter diazotrophicus TaxID=1920512 RepID=A0A4R6RDK1_9HYPH|nr:ABC transporter ATP-binding protein [Oharaeibacter diazotrophicus]TDP84222.1 NitT/TauT family transport system ATP-binding protein [Oharaeibacter diazotrophicus]BBE73260.1 bicarbonate transport ATP-binding protein CmpD [Pleomorphomonas sp. SM30]GLS75051.1 nitrate ABC transporter ATP-binding protein [Oharaeibacter diazotrophicus]